MEQRRISHQRVPRARGGWISQKKTTQTIKILQTLSEVEAKDTQIFCIKARLAAENRDAIKINNKIQGEKAVTWAINLSKDLKLDKKIGDQC